MIDHSCLPIEVNLVNLKTEDDLEHLESLRRPYIKSGYLDLSHSDVFLYQNNVKSILHTLWSLHNETFNIYTHLVPSILIILKLFFDLLSMILSSEINTFYQNHNMKDILLFGYVVSIVGCLLFSVWYHIGRCCLCHTEHDLYYLLKLDLFGIWLINTLTVPASAFILFECHQYPFIDINNESDDHDTYFTIFIFKHFNLQYFYTVLFLSYSLFIIVPMMFIYPHLTGYKIKLFGISLWIFSMCCSSFHAVLLQNDTERSLFTKGPIFLACFFAMAFLCLYYHIPESIYPGRFDFIGSSHQLFHICIAAAAIWWWYFLHFMSEYRDIHGCI